MKKRFIFLFILIIIVLLSLILYNNYTKYDINKFKMVTYEKDMHNKTYVISILVPNYFEEKLEYELITKLEESLKKEKDIEKKKLLERQLKTDTYYYGYDEFYDKSSPSRLCATYISLFELKSNNKKPEKNLNYFMDYFKSDNYKTIDIKNSSFKFNIIAVKKSNIDNQYHIYLENKKYILQIYATLTNNTQEKEESEYLKNLIKTIHIQQKTP